MTTKHFQVTKAKQSDLDEVLRLLEASALPTAGVVDHLLEFFVALDPNGRLVGCAAIEDYGPVGLLRSVAVAAELRRSGLGSRLVSTALDYSKRKRISEVVLLTTTAREFFERQFGFAVTERAPYEQTLAPSAEWRHPPCASAVVMSLRFSQEPKA